MHNNRQAPKRDRSKACVFALVALVVKTDPLPVTPGCRCSRFFFEKPGALRGCCVVWHFAGSFFGVAVLFRHGFAGVRSKKRLKDEIEIF